MYLLRESDPARIKSTTGFRRATLPSAKISPARTFELVNVTRLPKTLLIEALKLPRDGFRLIKYLPNGQPQERLDVAVYLCTW